MIYFSYQWICLLTIQLDTMWCQVQWSAYILIQWWRHSEILIYTIRFPFTPHPSFNIYFHWTRSVKLLREWEINRGKIIYGLVSQWCRSSFIDIYAELRNVYLHSNILLIYLLIQVFYFSIFFNFTLIIFQIKSHRH